jgi:hypothetical protein
MDARSTHRSVVTVAMIAGMALTGSAWAGKPRPVEIRQVGRTAVVYRGSTIDVALSYRFATTAIGDRWLLLDTAMTSPGDVVAVPRGAISVRTPSGEVVPLATQVAFEKDYGGLLSTIRRADIAREPLNYFVPHRFRRLDYFAVPGRGLAFDTVWLDEWHNAYGRLYFKLPNGVQKGQYELLIDLPKEHVAIPFTL